MSTGMRDDEIEKLRPGVNKESGDNRAHGLSSPVCVKDAPFPFLRSPDPAAAFAVLPYLCRPHPHDGIRRDVLAVFVGIGDTKTREKADATA